tara:strand:+ start:197 stop:682 length:486 start_codon:yes stop_codon:yes gene_type:complete
MIFTKDVLLLGIHDIKTLYDIYNFIGPYLNEMANLLTFTILVPFYKYNLYVHNTNDSVELIRRYAIDFLALSSIISNAVYYTRKYQDFKIGFLKGLLLLFFSFIVPTIYLKSFSIGLGGSNNILRFVFGIIFIYLLDFSVNTSMYIYLKYRQINKINKNNK